MYWHTPGKPVLLYDLRQIKDMWGKDAETVYRKVALGELHAYSRPGRQKYYSAAELYDAFGAPQGNPPAPEENAKGGYQQGSLFETSRAA